MRLPTRRARPRAPDRKVQADCRCRNPFGDAADDPRDLVLDVRDLPLQGQVGRTLAAAETLPAGRRIRHVNTSVPWPLLAMLETRGCMYRLVGRTAGELHLLVWARRPGATERSPA